MDNHLSKQHQNQLSKALVVQGEMKPNLKRNHEKISKNPTELVQGKLQSSLKKKHEKVRDKVKISEKNSESQVELKSNLNKNHEKAGNNDKISENHTEAQGDELLLNSNKEKITKMKPEKNCEKKMRSTKLLQDVGLNFFDNKPPVLKKDDVNRMKNIKDEKSKNNIKEDINKRIVNKKLSREIKCHDCKVVFATKESRSLHTCNSILDRFISEEGKERKTTMKVLSSSGRNTNETTSKIHQNQPKSEKNHQNVSKNKSGSKIHSDGKIRNNEYYHKKHKENKIYSLSKAERLKSLDVHNNQSSRDKEKNHKNNLKPLLVNNIFASKSNFDGKFREMNDQIKDKENQVPKSLKDEEKNHKNNLKPLHENNIILSKSTFDGPFRNMNDQIRNKENQAPKLQKDKENKNHKNNLALLLQNNILLSESNFANIRDIHNQIKDQENQAPKLPKLKLKIPRVNNEDIIENMETEHKVESSELVGLKLKVNLKH